MEETAKDGDGKYRMNTRIALLEQSIEHTQQILTRIERHIDNMDKKCERIETKMENSFRWIMTTSLGAFFSLTGLVFAFYQIFKG